MIKICSRCVMDSSIPEIKFSKKNYCNYCEEFLKVYSYQKNDTINIQRKQKLSKFIEDAKTVGKNKKYDCVVGLSGGVDSAWTLIKVIQSGLRPLAVHMDNGWNSELAQNNIRNLVAQLEIDLYTHVIEWEEYRELMQCFFDANVVDIELLYDNAFIAVLYQQAYKFGLKHVVAGTNSSTEGMSMPKNWNWFKLDKKNIKDIAKIRNVKIKTMPTIGVKFWFYCEYIKKIKWVSFPEYFDYKKNEATNLLIKEFSFKPYPYKHYESIFTRFYQGYILPNKFNIDKRKLHLSNLIVTSQITREEALKELIKIPYPSKKELNEDIDYFLKKMNWSKDKLKNYLNIPREEHNKFKSEKWLYEYLYKKLQKMVPKNLYKYLKNSYAIK